MKNLKVSMKLIVSFLIVAVLTIVVGVVGIVGMLQIDKADTEMYEMQTAPMPSMAKILEAMQKMRVNVREYMIASFTDDDAKLERTRVAIEEEKKTMEDNFDIYYKSILTREAGDKFNEARDLYYKEYVPFLQKCYDLANVNNTDQILVEFNIISPVIDKIVGNFDDCLNMKTTKAKETADNNSVSARRLLIIIIVVLVVVIVIALILAFYISGLISKPISALSEFMKKASSTGDIILTQEEEAVVGKYQEDRDEIGQLVKAASGFISRIAYISGELETIANGDLTSDVQLLSDADVMGSSMQKMVDNLNNMFSGINTATGQVSSGSKQVADGAQSLAQGSTQQAASVQELSSSIGEVAQKTKENAQLASNAADLANTIKDNAEKGSHQMDEMMTAVKDINQASQNISKVIKVIDDIAFQTNILALNAAVEAARAGQHGKGFAVVAEEVRNLASKSAEAAKETGSMIENSMEKAELGARIAGETAESLTEIVSGISESSELVREIARASEEQSLSIGQINVGLDQVAQVVQQNSATAEESAAASEEMSSQSSLLQELISQFRTKNSGSGYSLPPASGSPSRHAAPPPKSDYAYSGGNDNFGKY